MIGKISRRRRPILLIGSNITETNPLTAVRIKEAIRVYKAQVVTLDSAITNMAKLASHPFLIKPGTEGLVIDGLVKATIDQDLVDEEAIGKHPQAFAALKAAVADHFAGTTWRSRPALPSGSVQGNSGHLCRSPTVDHSVRGRHRQTARTAIRMS